MSEKHRNINYSIRDIENFNELALVCQALSSPIRLHLLHLVCQSKRTIPELAKLLHLSTSAVEFHIKALEQSKIIDIVYTPYKKGHVRYITRYIRHVGIDIDVPLEKKAEKTFVYSMPVSQYIEGQAEKEFGLAAQESYIHLSHKNLFDPRRFGSDILWTSQGLVSYAFPNEFVFENDLKSLLFSLEICSEAPGYNNEWKSDITFLVNDVELLTWTSPGDLGDRKGRLSPSWWSELNATQYGFLKTILITDEGVSLDGKLVNSKVSLASLMLSEKNYIKFTIANYKNATYEGGFSILGKSFGDYPQDIEMIATTHISETKSK